MFLRFTYIAACVCLSAAYIQELTLYSEPNFEGNAIRFRSKFPNASDFQFFIPQVKSFCVTGLWSGYSGVEYTIALTLDVFDLSGTTFCRNLTISPLLSLRFKGPLDTTTPSVSLYRGDISEDPLSGEERIITNLAATNFGFVPTAMVLTGRSSWTGFTNDDFSGNSTCFQPQELIHAINLAGITIRSVVQGCNAKYGSYYYKADDKMQDDNVLGGSIHG